MSNRFKIVIEFVYQRRCRGDIHLRNVIVRDIVEDLYERPYAVSVSGDEDSFAGSDLRTYLVFPIRLNPCDRIF